MLPAFPAAPAFWADAVLADNIASTTIARQISFMNGFLKDAVGVKPSICGSHL
jgi:hypothetical protein